MKIYTEISDLSTFKPWEGAVNAYNRLIDAGKDEAFIQALDDVYPNGVTKTQLNDLLWYEKEWCYSLVGLNKHGYEPIDTCDLYDSKVVQDYIEKHFEELNKDVDPKVGYWIDDDTEMFPYIEEWIEENQDSDDLDEVAQKWLDECGKKLIEEYTYFKDATEE